MSHHYSGPALGFPHGDARLDLTDLYAFGKPGDDRKSILIMNVHPSFSLEPRGPTRSDSFAHEGANPDIGEFDIRVLDVRHNMSEVTRAPLPCLPLAAEQGIPE
jgi:hypothetical protein